MSKENFLRSSGLFSLATLLSRILGLVRDSCIAAFLPKAWQDIFWAGIKIPSTFRQLFAEGALSAAFIPLLTRVREQEGENKAQETAHAIFTLLFLVVSLVVVISILLAPWFVPFILDFPEEEAAALSSPTTSPPDTDWRITAGIRVTQLMFPFLLFVALSAWAMGVLNTYRRFFIPAVASAFFNVSVIAGAFLSAGYLNLQGMPMMIFMTVAVIFGGFLQYAVQLPQCRTVGYFPHHIANPIHPRVKQFLRMLAPTVFGLAIYQINALVTQTYFASKYGEGGISMMQYAFRLIQFPLGVVGVALATASFPQIAQQIEKRHHSQAAQTLTDVLKYLMLLMIPAAIGLIALGEDIVGAIYNRREFREGEMLLPTYHVLIFYCLGLLAFTSVKVLVRTFQAHHDFRTPVLTGAIGVTSNILFCAYFVYIDWPLWALALASSLASSLHALILTLLIRARMHDFRLLTLVFFGFRVLLASGIMGFACYLATTYFPIEGTSLPTYSLRIFIGMSLSFLVYGAMGWLLFPHELKRLLKLA